MKFSSTSNTSVQRCLYPLFQNQSPHFLLPPLIRRISQSSYQNQQNGKQTYYHPLIFLWTFKGFIISEHFLNFFSNLYIPPWFQKSFKFMVLRLLANIFVSQKIESIDFYSCSQARLSPQVLIITPQAGWNYPF